MTAASPKRTLATALAAGVTVLLGATPAGAQEASPQPTSCAGLAFTDQPWDERTTRENLDLTAGFWRYVPNVAGESVLTANIRVTNLDQSWEVGAYYHAWTFSWTNGSTRQYVRAAMYSDDSVGARGDVIYSYGIEGGDNVTGGETTGRLFLGEDGIIEIVVPVAEFELAGKRLTDPRAVSEVVYSDGLNTYPPIVSDRAPNRRTTGKHFDVVPCAQQAAPTAPAPATAPAQPADAPRLKLEVVSGKLSARKISKRRSVAIALRAGEQTTALKARLMRGKRSVATGRLASISGKGTVKLRLRDKKLKAGTYTLELTGRTAAGQVASGRVKVRVRP